MEIFNTLQGTLFWCFFIVMVNFFLIFSGNVSGFHASTYPRLRALGEGRGAASLSVRKPSRTGSPLLLGFSLSLSDHGALNHSSGTPVPIALPSLILVCEAGLSSNLVKHLSLYSAESSYCRIERKDVFSRLQHNTKLILMVS